MNVLPTFLKKGAVMSTHEKIDYVEFPANNLEATKKFFTKAFGWKFADYGPEYCDFSNEGLKGGFYKSEKKATTEAGSALIIFYSLDLEATQTKVIKAGGVICKEIFSFPGGCRFHFVEPSGNEFAVWSDKDESV
jgi:predicted enzyme related to lactoylglutathione lyase